MEGARISAASNDGDGEGFDWIVGDALDANAVRRAAEGSTVIIHAVNPLGYRNWDTLVLPNAG